jgi:hypothetical protein
MSTYLNILNHTKQKYKENLKKEYRRYVLIETG